MRTSAPSSRCLLPMPCSCCEPAASVLLGIASTQRCCPAADAPAAEAYHVHQRQRGYLFAASAVLCNILLPLSCQGSDILRDVALLLQTHPQLKIILYISGSGGLLERMAACKPDIMSIDQHVDMRDAIQRIGPDFAVQVRLSACSITGWLLKRHTAPRWTLCTDVVWMCHTHCRTRLL